jgi:hypothetical protein
MQILINMCVCVCVCVFVCVYTHTRTNTHTHYTHIHTHTHTHTHNYTQVAYPDPDLNPRAYAKYGAVQDSCVQAFRREIEMMALVRESLCGKKQKGEKGIR